MFGFDDLVSRAGSPVRGMAVATPSMFLNGGVQRATTGSKRNGAREDLDG
jgi:hypothetical protein